MIISLPSNATFLGFFFVKTNGGQIITERGVGFVKPLACQWKGCCQILAHPDGLGALTGKYQCCLAHEPPDLAQNSGGVEEEIFRKVLPGQAA